MWPESRELARPQQGAKNVKRLVAVILSSFPDSVKGEGNCQLPRILLLSAHVYSAFSILPISPGPRHALPGGSVTGFVCHFVVAARRPQDVFPPDLLRVTNSPEEGYQFLAGFARQGCLFLGYSPLFYLLVPGQDS